MFVVKWDAGVFVSADANSATFVCAGIICWSTGIIRVGRDSLVGIATGYCHEGLGIDSSSRAIEGEGLRPLACWDCGFESHRVHGCPCLCVVQ